jgi:diaminopimelate epimerase
LFEKNPVFPQGVNTEFVEIINRRCLKMRVWERGSWETLACGTGACAAVAAAVVNGYCDEGTDVTVCLPGGELIINYTSETVLMTGDCIEVFDGTVDLLSI